MKQFAIAVMLLIAAGTAKVYGDWPYGKILTPLQADSLAGEAFVAIDIPEWVKVRITGKSYNPTGLVNLNQLKYIPILHRDAEGNILGGELICNAMIASDLEAIFKELYREEYPIERMVLIDAYNADDIESMRANNTSCFNYRVIAGSNKLSKHAEGLAIDLNPLYNPYVKGEKVSPPEGVAYSNRKGKWNYKIERDDPAHRLFKKYGFRWGGDWKSLKDWQHFEK